VIAFLVIVYTALVLVLFKVLRIKPTAYIIASMLVAGVLMIGGVVVVWALSAPITDKLVTSQYVVQLVPYVKGQVKAVYAQPNQPMKRDDVLLEIDPAPYQFTLSQVEAQLNAAKANVKQAEAGLEAANANAQKAKDDVAQAQAAVDQANAAVATAQATLAKAKAADDLAKTQEQIALNIQHQNVAAISQLNVAKARQERQEADAAVQQAEAGVSQAQAAARQAVSGLAAAQSGLQQAQAAAQQAAFAVQVAQNNVLAIEAQLGDARFNLAQCTMRAPTDGYVVNWQVQVGTMLVALPFAPAGTFVNTADIAVAAVFPQNWLAHVEPGDDVEMVLNPYPGRLFLGKVDYVIPATGGGQFTTSGTIPNAARVGSDGLYAVRINFSDAAVARNLSLGSGGSAVIYTKSGKPTHIISKVAIRMKKWLLYVIPTVERPPS
jgi:multidrug resistance efflux pump